MFHSKIASAPPSGLLTVAALLPIAWEKRLVDVNVRRLMEIDLAWADLVFILAMTVQRASAEKIIDRCRQVGKPIVAGGPRWELADLKSYDTISLQFSRGCPLNCDFCNVTALFGQGPRTRTAAQIIAELDRLYALGWRKNLFFVDDNFIGNKKQIKTEILPALNKWQKGKSAIPFQAEVSINLANDDKLLRLTAQAGFDTVYVGMETLNEASLSECSKSQNWERDLIESVKHSQRAGLQVQGGFIFGFDNDTPAVFQQLVDFIQKSGIVTAMVGLLQAPYGMRLYERMAQEGRILSGASVDNVDGNTNILTNWNFNISWLSSARSSAWGSPEKSRSITGAYSSGPCLRSRRYFHWSSPSRSTATISRKFASCTCNKKSTTLHFFKVI